MGGSLTEDSRDASERKENDARKEKEKEPLAGS